MTLYRYRSTDRFVSLAVCVLQCVAGSVLVCVAVCCRVCCSVTGTMCCDVFCIVCCRVVPYVAEWCRVLQRSAGEIIIMMISHCNSVLQCVAVCCHVVQCADYSPCTTCRAPSLPTHALLPLAVYPRPPLPRRQRHARFGLQSRGSWRCPS